ncbi:MAG: hypothetical protein IH608_13305 [Proteobacteria bacterium]|nr:hypothetical protein [Pseudomonadota bacterium]
MGAERRLLWWSLVGLAGGAVLLHLRIHPPNKGIAFFWGNFFAWADLVAVSALFLSRRTAVYGLLLNSFIAILGVILMADFTLANTLAGKVKVAPGEDFLGWLLLTTLPDIAILVGDFLAGQALYRVMTRGSDNPPLLE